MTAPWGLYVHVPWCRARCPYCAFTLVTSTPQGQAFRARIAARLAEEAAAYVGPPSTVYLGGGTPTRLDRADLLALLDALPAAPERTIEANPEDVDDDLLDALLDHGVTRISLGVQSFVPSTARRLGRATSSIVAARVAASVARRFPTWSLDLIFAVPGQTEDQVAQDLAVALDLGVPHLSAYGLTLEEGTRFGRARRLPSVDDEQWRAHYARVRATLASGGLDRYEVSNFARPGHESRHNRLYWTPGAAWMGLGPGATGRRPDGALVVEGGDVARWLGGAPPTVEPVSPDEALVDLLHTALRTREGLDPAVLRHALGVDLDARVVEGLRQGGLLSPRTERVVASEAGFYVLDAIVRRLLDATRPISGRLPGSR